MLETIVLRPAFFPRFLNLADGYFVSVRDYMNGQLVFRYNADGELTGSDTLGIGDCYYSYLVNGEPRLVSQQSVFLETNWQMRTVIYEFDAQGMFSDSVVLRQSDLPVGENPSGHAFHYDGNVLTAVTGSVVPNPNVNNFRVWLTTYDGSNVMPTPPWNPGPFPLHAYVTSWGILRTTSSEFVLSAFVRGDEEMQFWFFGLNAAGEFEMNLRIQQVEQNHLLNGLIMFEYAGSLIYAFTEVTTDGSFGGGARIAAFPLSELLRAPGDLPEVPSAMDLHAYPNPFNPRSTLEFSLANTSFTRLAVYDLLGREVAVLADEQLSAGRHTRTWNAADFASGKYFVRLSSGDKSRVIPLTLTK